MSPFVNTNLEQWRFKQNIGVSDRVLKTFQTAQNIRTMYFEPGSQKLKIGFRLKPIYLDKHITHLLVELDGQELSYRHGPTRMTQFFGPAIEVDYRLDSFLLRQTQVYFQVIPLKVSGHGSDYWMNW